VAFKAVFDYQQVGGVTGKDRSNGEWRRRESSFGTRTQELHAYPRPRGRVLRYIGEDLETESELLVDHHIADILEFKKERDSIGKFNSSPYPKGWSGKRRAG
jgi:hypothetical protein